MINSGENEILSFADAVRQDIVSVFDNECLELILKTGNNILSELQFEENASAVIGQFLCHMYTFNRPRFQELFLPIKEAYLLEKKEDDAECSRNAFQVIKGNKK